MMCKGRKILFAALLLLCTALSFCAMAEQEKLLVLSDEAAGGAAADAVAVVRKLAVYNNFVCTFADAREETDISGYTRVIVCMNENTAMDEKTALALTKSELPVFVLGSAGLEQLSKTQTFRGSIVLLLGSDEQNKNELLVYGEELTFLSGDGEEQGGDVYVGAVRLPLCKTVGNITHLAYFDPQQEELCALLATLLQSWMWPYRNAPTSYGGYLVLDQVYPFTDPEKLMAISEMLEECDVPYAICVMPLYANAEYPAMKRFCEYLRYAQSKGNGIILHVPLITLENVEAEDVKKNMESAFSGYTQYGVYPVALAAPVPWLQSQKGLDILAGCRTVFLFESDEQVMGEKPSENIAVKDGHQLIAPAYSSSGVYTTAFAQAVYLDVNQDVNQDIETLRAQVLRLKNSGRAQKKLSKMQNTFYAGDHLVKTTEDGGYFYDNKSVSTVYEPFVYTSYTYDRGFARYLTEQIQTSNHYILIFVFLSCGFFVTAIWISRRVMRRELLRGGYHSSPPAEKEEEHK